LLLKSIAIERSPAELHPPQRTLLSYHLPDRSVLLAGYLGRLPPYRLGCAVFTTKFSGT
jgi:hypothetical protein